MDETIILFVKYRDSIAEYEQMHKVHFLKRRKLKKQIRVMDAKIKSYNNANDIFSFVNGIYVLLSSILYDSIKKEESLKKIRIVKNILFLHVDNIDIWFMAKTQWFEVSEPNLLYSIYRDDPPKNSKILERWNLLYPKIFALLYPIITVDTIRRENS